VACYNNRELVTFDTSDDSSLYTLTFSSGATPYGVGVLPDGSYVYVADPGNDVVYKITAAGDPPTIDQTISVSNGPLSVAATPDSAYVYVGRGSGIVAMIDTSTNTSTDITITGAAGGIYGIAVSPDGTTVYVTDDSDGEVYYFAAGEASPTINNITTISDTSITGIGFAPDSTVYVANTSAGTVSYFPMGTTSPTVNNISVGTNPIAFGQFISSQGPLPFPSVAISDWFGC
jgi:DNA-binding beta-propeller fold protein YncE